MPRPSISALTENHKVVLPDASQLVSASLLQLMRSPANKTHVLVAIIVINLLVFLAMLAAGSGLWHTAHGIPLAWGANFGPATQDGQWWRLVTAMFVHFGLLHLVMNLWALWDVGRLLERLYGSWRLAAMYLGCGVFGNCVSLVIHGNEAVSGGASGAIFGLYGALIIFLWRERSQIELTEYRWLFGGTLIFTLLILGVGFAVPGIDNAAHAGGLFAGTLAGTFMGRPWTSQSPAVKARGMAGFAFALALGALFWRLPEPAYRFSEEVRAQGAISEFLISDYQIEQEWQGLLSPQKGGSGSFEQLAGGIDRQIVAGYERSFERLLDASPSSEVPSATRLAQLQIYARLRAEAAKELAEGLRERDTQKIKEAVEQARDAAAKAKNPGDVPNTESPSSR